MSLSTYSLRGRKQSDPLVIANRGRLKSNLSRDFRNRKWGHDYILVQPILITFRN
jgi:hypothetical protein